MTKPMTKVHATEAITPFQPMTAFHGAILERLTRSGETCAEACLAWQQELFRFTSSRLQCDAKVGQALASCTNMADVIELQKGWLDAAATDFFDEGRRMIELAAKLAPAYLMPFTPASADPTEGRAAAE